MIKYNSIDPIDPAMKVEDPQEAKEYFQDYVADLMKMGVPQDTAEKTAKTNIGYHAGYHPTHVRRRVERLFDCEHPFFGKIAEMGEPTAEEAFRCGYERKTLKQIRSETRNSG